MDTETDAGAEQARVYARTGPLPIRKIGMQDLREALRKGWNDFSARPFHGLLLATIYVLIALFTTAYGLGVDLMPLLLPLISGFALIGPIAACGLYSLSRRRESGEAYTWWHVFDVFSAPSRGAIASMGVVLAAVFALWLYTALLLSEQFLGAAATAALPEYFSLLFTTTAGLQLLAVGFVVGLLFSAAVFVATIISLPLLLDRKISIAQAVGTSLRAVRINVRAMAAWFLLVAVLLFLGALPFLIGWAVVVPVIGHATWHLYRHVVDV